MMGRRVVAQTIGGVARTMRLFDPTLPKGGDSKKEGGDNEEEEDE